LSSLAEAIPTGGKSVNQVRILIAERVFQFAVWIIPAGTIEGRAMAQVMLEYLRAIGFQEDDCHR
jgi:hypothetical protein